ncbi:hypothetical protein [Actinomadura decatromicini]|uniref:Uncharacterized protein n=1 Tax=Actinomadura decatromicini TaxID=2604572 RepID=A0A5D3FE34_9ACTN|nr:hypothetical protein [Actinomadura decatromicini]TYK47147.1 hypothetical protein FXF68_25430 [Actinomadura decatromicini]
MGADETPGVELAMLRGEVMTTLARIEGEIRLVRQAQEESARRTDDLQRDVHRLDDRVDHLDRTTVTREELDQRDNRLREDADKRQAHQAEQARRALTIWALVISAIAAVLTGVGVFVSLTVK